MPDEILCLLHSPKYAYFFKLKKHKSIFTNALSLYLKHVSHIFCFLWSKTTMETFEYYYIILMLIKLYAEMTLTVTERMQPYKLWLLEALCYNWMDHEQEVSLNSTSSSVWTALSSSVGEDCPLRIALPRSICVEIDCFLNRLLSLWCGYISSQLLFK